MMNSGRLFQLLLAALVLVLQIMQPASAQAQGAGGEKTSRVVPRPFPDKPLAVGHIRAEREARFQAWAGGGVPLGTYHPEAFDRTRMGSLNLSPSLRVHVDAVANKVHFPSYFELLDAKSGRLLGLYPVFDIDDAEWYFPGNGIAYLNQRHMSLCGSRYTRKLVVSGSAIAEVRQPLIYIGEETTVVQPTPLYDSPTGRAIVARVLPDSKVHVIGLASDKSEDPNPPLLVRTPFGLTGWHRHQGNIGEGQMEIYLCN